MEKKIVLTIFALVCLLTTTLVVQLKLGVGEEVYYDRYEPWDISGTWVLKWDLYPWHTVRFIDCDVGFNITGDNTVLDLKGHKAIFVRGAALGPGRSGIEINGKSSVTFMNGTIINFQYGVWVENSNKVDISSINVSAATRQGIGVRNSSNVNLNSNTVSDSAIIGVGIDQNSFDVSMTNNDITGSGDVGIGIYNDCSDISILNNRVTTTGDEGIHLTDSNYITVGGNEISDCRKGTYLYKSNNITINNNTLSNNTAGIHLESASQNIIYHNNFIDNEKHVTNVGSTNSWDVGYGTIKDAGYGGNYWDDYEGVDEYSGANKNVPGSDGLGDTPYDKIGEGSKDNYPLMNPWGLMLTELGVNGKTTCYVAVFSNSSITDFSFSKTEAEIGFTASNGTFCKVIIPKDALDGSFNMSIDDVTTACISNWDKTHHFINFAFNNQTHSVKIIGEVAIRGDLNGDGTVDILDIALVARAYGKKK